MSDKFRNVAHAAIFTSRNAGSVSGSRRGYRVRQVVGHRPYSDGYNIEDGGDSPILFPTRAELDNGLTPLMLAARDSKHNIVEKLLELGAVVTDRDKEGRTALHYAAATGSDGIVKLLLNKKVDPTQVAGPLDQLPLHMACSRPSGALEIVKTLLKVSGKDCKLTVDKNGSTPLFLAVAVGNQQVVKELLLSQAEQQVNIVKGETGDTVLHAAIKRKDIEIAKILIEATCPVDVQNHEGQTALHVAAMEGDEAVVKFLYSVKADANVTDSHDRTALHLAAQRGHSSIAEFLVDKFKANVNLRTKDGSTLMHVAAEAGHPDTAMVFLKKGVPLHMPNKDGAVCLHTAARKGHTSVVKSLLQKGATVDAKTKDDYTALHIAVQHGKPQVVQTLLGFGANVQLKGGKEQQTPLHIAARIKDGERVAEMLLKSGADVNAPRVNGETSVHLAARFGNLATLKLLIKEKADAARRAKNGETPLHHAIKSGRYLELEELLKVLYKTKSKAVAKLVLNMPTDKGETPLHYAAQLTKAKVRGSADIEIVNILLRHGADCTAVTHTTKETPLHDCARSGNNDILGALLGAMSQRKIQAAVNRRSSIGLAPLHIASEKGHVDVVKTLLRYQARVDVFDETGKAALHFAAERGHLAVAQELLEHKAYVNAKTKVGLTPLHLASENGHKELVGLLVNKYQGSVDALTLDKKTPLHLAAEKGRILVCEHLLELKADISFVDNKGQTPLHYAAQNDHSEVVALFLKHKPDVMLQHNSEGSTCVHIAAMKGSVSVMKELIRFNASGILTTRNKSKYATPLLLAASGGHKAVVEVLIGYGAPASDEDVEGMTVLHLAAKYGHLDVLEVLRGKVPWSMASVKTGLSALHVAARYGQIEVVREMLLKVPGTLKSESPSVVDSEKGDYSYTPLHLAAQSGHVDVVRILLNSPGVRVDSATAIQGSIPLHLAAENGQSEVVSILLSKSTVQLHVKDKVGRSALHLAASNGHRELVSQLIGQGADINAPDENGCAPIHMSAEYGHVDVVKLLVESGASPRVENKEGKFPICYAAASGHVSVVNYLLQQEMNTDRLLADRKFLFDLMVCSKSNDSASVVDFILQTPAPIYSAAKLSRHYRVESSREKERGRDLLAVSTVCETVAVELLSLACADNPEALLSAVDDRDIPFLDFLIETEQKDCVSHPTVQVYLGDVWRGDFKWDDWKYFLLFIMCLLCPPFWAFLCLPWKDRFHKVPIIKFICHLISHLYLIILFCLTTVVPWNSSAQSLIPHWYELLLLIWLSGLLLSQLTDPHDRAGLGWMPLIVLFLSLIAILLHLLAIAFQGEQRLNIVYTRNQFLAVSMMLCFAQLLDFLSFHHLFGPWGVIIRDLMYDMVRFLVILSIFMMGFTAHLAAVYRPMLAKRLDSKAMLLYGQSFGFYQCFELLFFSLFGLTEMDSLQPTGDNHPSATHLLAKATFGIYNVITIIVLINLLIAMMSDTYQRIQRQSDTEWKFGRAKLIRNMKRSTTTPSPLNLLTKLISYLRVLYRAKCRCCRADIIDVLRTDDQFVLENTSVSLNVLYTENSVSSWLPNGGLRHRESASRSPRIEDVLDWKLLVNKFIALRGGNTEAIKISRPSSRKQPDRLHTGYQPRQRRPASVLGLGKSGSSFGSNMSLHRVVNETVKKLDIVSSMKE
ncbi:serine/threonine-protein phosphatase 6 regulatory ankyrin repeat subunit A-like isoform X3 [Nematostella vectensis]|uniref:NompC n=1 Tax=Nematostella vectensis TaxID=45351 RepID=A0A6M5K7T2_NEMVE|nr:serine/threonine-protein phosphatase 6 regulatory ankyrin repeat subunit A-like isoform X3 [Nematostella vectensis]QJU69485.1 nompC [Nematostella vectensis]